MIVLISEDNEDLRHMLTMALEDAGMTVHATADGEEAILLLEEGRIPFDVLVTDFNMPKMNGAELVRSILAKGIELKRIIIMSGLPDNEPEVVTLSQNFPKVTFLHKSFKMDILLKMISH